MEGEVGAMDVEVVRSSRRHKTVQAWEVGGVLRVAIPARMSPADRLAYHRQRLGLGR